MIEIKIDVIDRGIESERRTIDTLKIVNTGEHACRPDYGDYICQYSGGEFKIDNHYRDYGTFELLKRCFDVISFNTGKEKIDKMIEGLS